MNRLFGVALIVTVLHLLYYGFSFAGEIRLGQFATLMNQDGSHPVDINGEYSLSESLVDRPDETYEYPFGGYRNLWTQCFQANHPIRESQKRIDDQTAITDWGIVGSGEIISLTYNNPITEQFDDPLAPPLNDLDAMLIEQQAITEGELNLDPAAPLSPLPDGIPSYVPEVSAAILLFICVLTLVFNRKKKVQDPILADAQPFTSCHKPTARKPSSRVTLFNPIRHIDKARPPR